MQASDSLRHAMLVRGIAVLCVVFTLVALSCRPLPAQAQAQADAPRGDRSGEFGTSVTVVPSADGKVPTVRFDWVVPAGTQLIPGDNVTISFPDWLETARSVRWEQHNARCASKQASRSVTCTFIDVSAPQADVPGSVEIPVTTKNTIDSAPVKWGGRAFDLRKELAARQPHQANQAAQPHQANQADTANATKQAIPPADIVEAAHQRPNNRWDVIVSARQSRSGRVVVESSQADRGFVEVRRRDAGAAYERGTWEDAASIRCQPGGDLHAQQLGCAQRVFVADSAGEAYLPGAAGERVSVRSEAGSLAVVIDNPVRGAAYRVQFVASLPDPVIYVNGVMVSAPATPTVPTQPTRKQVPWYVPFAAVAPLVPWAFGALLPQGDEAEAQTTLTPVTSSALAAPLADATIATSAELVDRSHVANTGASIVGLALLLLLVILGGTAFVLRGRSTRH